MASLRGVLDYCNRVIRNGHIATTTAEKRQLDFRDLIWDSSNGVQRMLQTERSPLNKWQCLHLQRKLKDFNDLLRSYSGDGSNSGQVKEFYRIVKEAEDLVRQCCSQPWMRAAIAQLDNSESFCEVLYELEWCSTIMTFRGPSPASAPIRPKRRKRGTRFKILLAKRRTEIRSVNADAARKDRDELEARLKGELQKGSQLLSDNDLVLAKYLLSRLTDAKASKGVDKKRSRGECFNGGSFGHLYKISWLGETYAEKVFDFVKVEPSSSEDLRESFERESHALKSLRHRNVVQLIDHFSNDKEGSLVMEYMSSGDLRKLIDLRLTTSSSASPEGKSTPPFSLAVALDIMLQMAKGMRYMHAARVAHRDIKARNVLVSLVKDSSFLEAEGYVHVKLADFGMAKVKREPGSSISVSFNPPTLGFRVGTYLWKAPELFHQPDSDGPSTVVDPFAADVYSYGITCSEVITGLVPFSKAGLVPQEDEVFVTRIAVEGDRPELPGQEDDCPPALAFLISKCWSTDPANRPSAAHIVRYLHDFKASLLVDAAFDHLSWAWNFDPDNVEDDDLSSSDDENSTPPNEGAEPRAIEEQVGKSGLLLRAKDYVSWLTGGSIARSSTSGLSPGPSTAAEITSRGLETANKDVEIASNDVEITSTEWETKQFPFRKLQAATNNFHADPDNPLFIGEGPFAKIFRGAFTGKLNEAAVRELVFAKNADLKTFLENVSVMATIKHPNLITLAGYCAHEGGFYLVHEFIDAPGTIGTVLLGFSKPKDHPREREVQWRQRYQIAVRVGEALAYLHDRGIIHGLLTTRSIMLEEPDLNPRLFDFGMTYLFPEFEMQDDLPGPQYQSFITEKWQWKAPEHKPVRNNKLKTQKSPASDVYSFGILLLVLVCGKKMTEDGVPGSILDAACHIYNDGDVLKFLDVNLPAGSVASESVMLIMQVALLCLQEEPQRRPTASEAVQILLGEVAIAAERLVNITDRIKTFL